MAEDLSGVSLRFAVHLDVLPLGDWTKCEGLTVEYEIEEYKEGGQNDFVHRLPGRVKYQNIKLSRPLTKRSSEVLRSLAHISPRTSHTGSIELRDGANHKVIGWKLQGVYPVKWTGPTMDVSTNSVAIESLELAHRGFSVE